MLSKMLRTKIYPLQMTALDCRVWREEPILEVFGRCQAPQRFGGQYYAPYFIEITEQFSSLVQIQENHRE